MAKRTKKEETINTLAPKPIADSSGVGTQKVSRANFTFTGNASAKPSLEEETKTVEANTPPHPFELFRYLQDENPWVDLAVRVISSACSSTTPLFRIDGNDKTKTKIKNFTKKLMHPNQHTTGYELFYQTVSDLVLYGNSFWQVIKTKDGKELHSIYHIPAPNIMVMAKYDNNNQLVMGYKQIKPEVRYFTENEIIHFKTPNPRSFLYGKPVFYPNMSNITVDENVTKWVNAFFENTYGGGVIFEQEADEDVAARNRVFIGENFTKPENAGKPLLLEGGIKLISEGNKFREGLDFSSMKQGSREEILQHAGVPLSQAGIRSNNGQANIEVINSEEESFLRNTVGHYHKIIFSKLNQTLFQTIFQDEALEIKPGILSKFNNQNSIRLVESTAKVALQVNEHRELFGLQPIPDEFGGTEWVVATNNGIVPAKLIYGIDFNTGEKVKTLLEAQMEAGATAPGSTNLASNLTNPSGGVAGTKKLKPKAKAKPAAKPKAK